MCGRLNVSDDPFVTALIKELGVESPIDKVNFGRFKRATDTLSIVRQVNGKNVLTDATWWLLLDRHEQSFKPSKYTSFNTRYDKLNVPRSAGFQAFKESRCVIPAKGFGETEFVNKKPIHYHDMEAQPGQAIAFGGLYREWFHPVTGKHAYSCSIITLPPHPKLKNIHKKSMPLILPQHDKTIAMWLDESLQNTEVFNDLLNPYLPQALSVCQINKPSEYIAIEKPWTIAAD